MEYLDIYALADARNIQIVDENLEAISGLVTLFKDVPVTINLHMFNMAGEPYTEDALNNRIWSFIVAHDYNTTTTPQLRANAISVAGNVLKIEISNMNTVELNEQLKEEKSIRLGAELYGKSIEDSKDNWVMQFNVSIRNRRESNGIPTEVENNYYTKGEVDAKISGITLDVPAKVSELENDAGYITIEQVPEVDLSGYALKTDIPDVPAVVSAFQNDACYITLAEVPPIDLSNYYANKDILISANKDAESMGGDNWHYTTIEGGTGLTLKSENTIQLKANYITLDSYAGIKFKSGDDLILDRVPIIGNASANTAGGLVVVGSNGKIPENLYEKTEVNLTPYALKSEIPVVDVNKAYVDAELAKKLNSADAFSGSYNDLTDVPEIPVVPDNITTQGNVFNGANQLVKTDDTGKIPSELYDNGSSTEYTAGNGIAITDGVIAVKNSGYNVYTDTYRIRAIKEGKTSNNTYHQGEILIGSNVNETGIEITWRESTKYYADSSIYLRKTTGITMFANGGIRANNIYVDAKVANGGTVSTSYVARYENTGNIHTISLTAATACILTASNVPAYATLMIVVDNANAGSLLFGDEEVISTAETGKYALVFSNLGNSIKLYNKIEV